MQKIELRFRKKCIFIELHEAIPKDTNGQLEACQIHASSMMSTDWKPSEAIVCNSGDSSCTDEIKKSRGIFI